MINWFKKKKYNIQQEHQSWLNKVILPVLFIKNVLILTLATGGSSHIKCLRLADFFYINIMTNNIVKYKNIL